MRSPLLVPRIAIVDPELTYTMPQEVTASTGLDALTQLIESYVSNKANPLTDGICIEGMKRAVRSLSAAYLSGDASAREDMSIASLFSGLALANAKLGAVHGLAAPLGGNLSARHGMICARLLPFVVEHNINSLMKLDPTSDHVRRFDTVAKIMTNDDHASARDAVAWLKNICSELMIIPLGELGLKDAAISVIARQAIKSSSTKGNPVEVTEEELADILRRAM